MCAMICMTRSYTINMVSGVIWIIKCLSTMYCYPQISTCIKGKNLQVAKFEILLKEGSFLPYANPGKKFWEITRHFCNLERCFETLRTGDLIKFIPRIISQVLRHDLWDEWPWERVQALFGITRRGVSGDKTKKMTNKRFLVDTEVTFCFLGSRLHQKADLSFDLCVPRESTLWCALPQKCLSACGEWRSSSVITFTSAFNKITFTFKSWNNAGKCLNTISLKLWRNNHKAFRNKFTSYLFTLTLKRLVQQSTCFLVPLE